MQVLGHEQGSSFGLVLRQYANEKAFSDVILLGIEPGEDMYPAKADGVFSKLLVGTVINNGGHTTYDFVILIGQEQFFLAEFEGGIIGTQFSQSLYKSRGKRINALSIFIP